MFKHKLWFPIRIKNVQFCTVLFFQYKQKQEKSSEQIRTSLPTAIFLTPPQ